MDAAIAELYGLPPEEFTAARTRLVAEAKRAGDRTRAREIGALRRPTVSAWAVNRLAREAADEVGALLELGGRLRAAWSDGSSIGELDRRRAQLVDDLVRRARRLAEAQGRPLRDPAVREVEQTLQAALIDEAVADEVRDGRLAQPHSHSGFVPVGPPAPPAGPSSSSGTGTGSGGRDRGTARRRGTGTRKRADGGEAGSGRTKARPSRARSSPAQAGTAPQPAGTADAARMAERAEAAHREAERAETARREAALARQALDEWAERLDAAQRESDTADAEVERLTAELAAARDRRSAASRRLTVARREHDRAARAEAAAVRRLAPE